MSRQGRTKEGTKTKKEEEEGPGEGKAGRGREAWKEDGGRGEGGRRWRGKAQEGRLPHLPLGRKEHKGQEDMIVL